MFVRTAAERDVEAIYAVMVEALPAASVREKRHSIVALRGRVEAPRSEFIVADDGKTIAGAAFADTDGEGHVVTLRDLCVRPAMEGRGIGGLLLDEIEAAFPEARTVRVEVDGDNERAIAFLVAQGFAHIGGGNFYERPIIWDE